MKLFAIRGGIHPEYRKDLTAEKPIEPLPLPKLLYLPLQQHIGAPATPVVAVGEKVLKGQIVAAQTGGVSAPIHAPTSGTIVEIAPKAAPHPSGLPQLTIVLEPDGQDNWGEAMAPIADPFAAKPAEIAARVADAGIVGLGGAAFPSSVKLGLGARQKLEILLLNGAECEPYLTCDDRVMREYTAQVVDGARIIAHALGTPRIIIAVEGNKPQALELMAKEAACFANIEVVAVPVQYPMGSERHLTQAVTGLETPARKLTADLGVVVHNVGTARAVHNAVRNGRPLVARIITVTGGAVNNPKNLEVPLGTQIEELINFCGGFKVQPQRLVSGGPMMGQPLPSTELPVVKGTCGILALTKEEANEQPTQPCIRCGTCVTICPCGLVPVEMAAFIRKDHLEDAARIGVMDCVSCGSCSYVCPSHIPLVHYFNYAKGHLNAMDREKQKQERVKTLVQEKSERVEKAAQAKKAALAAAAAAKANKAAALPAQTSGNEASA